MIRRFSVSRLIDSLALFASATVMLAAYTNCSPANTSTPKADISLTSIGNPFSSVDLMESICSKLVSCNSGLLVSQCQNGVLATTGLAASLGLSNNSYNKYSDIVAGEMNGSVVGDNTKVSQCSQGVQTQNCGSTAVQNAYQPGSSTPFAGVGGLLSNSSSSCGTSLQTVQNSSSTTTIPMQPGGPGYATCIYFDIVLNGNGDYSCPIHNGLAFINAVLRTPPGSEKLFSDSTCTSLTQTDRLSFQGLAMSGNSTSGYIAGDPSPVQLNQNYTCQPITVGSRSGLYFSHSAVSTFDSGYSFCAWQSAVACP